MKKILLTLVATVLLTFVSIAQNTAVTNAYIYYKDEKDYEKARENIDKAINHPKTSIKSKTWTYRGLIYEKLAAATTSGELLVTAADSHKKSIELNENKGQVQLSQKNLKNIYNDALNWAFKKYEAKDLEVALSIYEAGIKINPQDTIAYLYASSVLIDLKNYDRLVTLNKELIATGFAKEKVYFNVLIGQLSKNTKEDSIAALQTLEEGMTANPNATKLAKTQIDIQIALGRKDEALKSINSRLDSDPNNPLLWCLKGTLLKGEEAERSFKKSYENISSSTKPNMVEFINFSIGNIYYNKAADLYNKVNNMGLSDYQKNGKKIEADAKVIMSKSIPYFEKAHEVNPKATDVIQSLITAYLKVGRQEDSDRMSAKLK